MTDQDSSDGPPRALLIAAVVVAASVLITVIGIAAVRQQSPDKPPVVIPSVPSPQAESPECHSLMASLPEQLGDYRRAATVDPTPPSTAAWQAGAGDEPVVLRCGVERPGDFVVGTPLQVVDAVQWFQVNEDNGPATTPQRSTWYAVDRPVYIALTLPAGAGPTPIQQLSAQIERAMPATPIDPASAP